MVKSMFPTSLVQRPPVVGGAARPVPVLPPAAGVGVAEGQLAPGTAFQRRNAASPGTGASRPLSQCEEGPGLPSGRSVDGVQKAVRTAAVGGSSCSFTVNRSPGTLFLTNIKFIVTSLRPYIYILSDFKHSCLIKLSFLQCFLFG